MRSESLSLDQLYTTLEANNFFFDLDFVLSNALAPIKKIHLTLRFYDHLQSI